ncbi:MAG: trigger factor [Gammaproteobacteria bacterium]|nr:MAG: trigger factor [Gammaproteobacteria bacterium]
MENSRVSKQVSLEPIDSLTRRLSVTIPAEQVDNEVSNRLRSLAATIRMDGFRPGKVPVGVVETKYGSRVRNEVSQELVQKTLQEAITEQAIKLAGQPTLDIQPSSKGEELSFTATFEVLPEFTMPDFSNVEIERPTAEITDADIDRVLDRMRLQKASWTLVERPAQEGDQVMIDYRESSSEEVSPLDSKTLTLVIGSHTLPDTFEQGLVGKSAGDEFTLAVNYPDSYADKTLAGREVEHIVTLISVSEAERPELDAEFARGFGIESGDLDVLREEVRNNMQRELEGKINALLKARVFEQISSHFTIDLPDSLVEEEYNRLNAQINERAKALNQTEKLPDPAELREEAARRVRNSMLISEATKQEKIHVSHEQIRQEVEKIAELYEEPEQITQWYYEDMNRLAAIEFKLAQDAFVNWVMEQGSVQEKNLSFDELMELAA